MAQAQQVQGIALNQASQGGLPEGDMEILDAAFCAYDYQGAVDHEILALGIQYQDGAGKTYDQYYSAGELTFFVPSDDGSMAVPVADKTMLSDSCNAWKFLASLLECGGEQMTELLGRGNVKELVGMKVHIQPFAQPKRQGLIRGGDQDAKEKSVILVTAILAWPGQAAPAQPKGLAGKGKPVQGRPATTAAASAPAKQPAAPPAVTNKSGLGGKGAQARAAAPASAAGKTNGQAGASTVASGDDDKTTAGEMLIAILLEAGGGLAKKDLAKFAFQKAGEMVTAGNLDAKSKTKIVQLVFQDSFLHELAGNGMIAFDGAQLSLPS
jgi:hypothetical protein